MGLVILDPEVVLLPKLYVDVPAGLRKLDFLYTNFSKQSPTKKKHLSLLKLGAFYHNLFKNKPNLRHLGSFISDENPPFAIPNFKK